MMPRVVILAIGDELLLGRTLDTNSAYLARWCTDRGLRVIESRILSDDEGPLREALLGAAAGAELVLVTGGLGPTLDDRTRHALAAAMEVPLTESAAAWKQVLAYYARIKPGAVVPESNHRQALTPRGARLLRNDRGTAPGLLGRVAGAWVACMPGVPQEMYAMVDRLGQQLPRLFPKLRIPCVNELHVAGIGESDVQDRLGDLLQGNGRLQIGITAHEAGHITIRVVGSQSAGQRHLSQVRRALKPWLLPESGVALSLVRHLQRRRQVISVAESCTCGQVAALLGAIDGVSAVFHEGIVTYHNDAKHRHLGVDPALIAAHGVVSEACVVAMAQGLRARSGADIACATSGIAGPGGGSREKPVGTVWVAVASKRGAEARLLHLRGGRERIQKRAAVAALQLVWAHLHPALEQRRG